jgi:hypothetical protein
VLHWRDTAKNAEWRERIDVAKEQGYSPWETLETFRSGTEVAQIASQLRRVERTVGFDPGETFGRCYTSAAGRDDSSMPAWRVIAAHGKSALSDICRRTGSTARDRCARGPVDRRWCAILVAGHPPARRREAATMLHEVFDQAAIATLETRGRKLLSLQAQLLRVVKASYVGVEPYESANK